MSMLDIELNNNDVCVGYTGDLFIGGISGELLETDIEIENIYLHGKTIEFDDLKNENKDRIIIEIEKTLEEELNYE